MTQRKSAAYAPPKKPPSKAELKILELAEILEQKPQLYAIDFSDLNIPGFMIASLVNSKPNITRLIFSKLHITKGIIKEVVDNFTNDSRVLEIIFNDKIVEESFWDQLGALQASKPQIAIAHHQSPFLRIVAAIHHRDNQVKICDIEPDIDEQNLLLLRRFFKKKHIDQNTLVESLPKPDAPQAQTVFEAADIASAVEFLKNNPQLKTLIISDAYSSFAHWVASKTNSPNELIITIKEYCPTLEGLIVKSGSARSEIFIAAITIYPSLLPTLQLNLTAADIAGLFYSGNNLKALGRAVANLIQGSDEITFAKIAFHASHACTVKNILKALPAELHGEADEIVPHLFSKWQNLAEALTNARYVETEFGVTPKLQVGINPPINLSSFNNALYSEYQTALKLCQTIEEFQLCLDYIWRTVPRGYFPQSIAADTLLSQEPRAQEKQFPLFFAALKRDGKIALASDTLDLLMSSVSDVPRKILGQTDSVNWESIAKSCLKYAHIKLFAVVHPNSRRTLIKEMRDQVESVEKFIALHDYALKNFGIDIGLQSLPKLFDNFQVFLQKLLQHENDIEDKVAILKDIYGSLNYKIHDKEKSTYSYPRYKSIISMILDLYKTCSEMLDFVEICRKIPGSLNIDAEVFNTLIESGAKSLSDIFIKYVTDKDTAQQILQSVVEKTKQLRKLIQLLHHAKEKFGLSFYDQMILCQGSSTLRPLVSFIPEVITDDEDAEFIMAHPEYMEDAVRFMVFTERQQNQNSYYSTPSSLCTILDACNEFGQLMQLIHYCNQFGVGALDPYKLHESKVSDIIRSASLADWDRVGLNPLKLLCGASAACSDKISLLESALESNPGLAMGADILEEIFSPEGAYSEKDKQLELISLVKTLAKFQKLDLNKLTKIVMQEGWHQILPLKFIEGLGKKVVQESDKSFLIEVIKAATSINEVAQIAFYLEEEFQIGLSTPIDGIPLVDHIVSIKADQIKELSSQEFDTQMFEQNCLKQYLHILIKAGFDKKDGSWCKKLLKQSYRPGHHFVSSYILASDDPDVAVAQLGNKAVTLMKQRDGSSQSAGILANFSQEHFTEYFNDLQTPDYHEIAGSIHPKKIESIIAIIKNLKLYLEDAVNFYAALRQSHNVKLSLEEFLNQCSSKTIRYSEQFHDKLITRVSPEYIETYLDFYSLPIGSSSPIPDGVSYSGSELCIKKLIEKSSQFEDLYCIFLAAVERGIKVDFSSIERALSCSKESSLYTIYDFLHLLNRLNIRSQEEESHTTEGDHRSISEKAIMIALNKVRVIDPIKLLDILETITDNLLIGKLVEQLWGINQFICFMRKVKEKFGITLDTPIGPNGEHILSFSSFIKDLKQVVRVYEELEPETKIEWLAKNKRGETLAAKMLVKTNAGTMQKSLNWLCKDQDVKLSDISESYSVVGQLIGSIRNGTNEGFFALIKALMGLDPDFTPNTPIGLERNHALSFFQVGDNIECILDHTWDSNFPDYRLELLSTNSAGDTNLSKFFRANPRLDRAKRLVEYAKAKFDTILDSHGNNILLLIAAHHRDSYKNNTETVWGYILCGIIQLIQDGSFNANVRNQDGNSLIDFASRMFEEYRKYGKSNQTTTAMIQRVISVLRSEGAMEPQSWIVSQTVLDYNNPTSEANLQALAKLYDEHRGFKAFHYREWGLSMESVFESENRPEMEPAFAKLYASEEMQSQKSVDGKILTWTFKLLILWLQRRAETEQEKKEFDAARALLQETDTPLVALTKLLQPIAKGIVVDYNALDQTILNSIEAKFLTVLASKLSGDYEKMHALIATVRADLLQSKQAEDQAQKKWSKDTAFFVGILNAVLAENITSITGKPAEEIMESYHILAFLERVLEPAASSPFADAFADNPFENLIIPHEEGGDQYTYQHSEFVE